MPNDHAILAPSASKRWMTCGPSARLEAQVASKETAYSKEGTIAHAMAEILLGTFLQEGPLEDNYVEIFRIWYDTERGEGASTDFLTKLTKQVDEALAEELDPWEMMQTVLDYYCRPVYEDYLRAKMEDPDAVLLIEQKFKLTEFIPEGFGSSDAVIIAGRTLSVYDLKYGKGVKVSAKNNPQMRCYALGAWCGPAELYDIDHIQMTIIQPRLQWISTDTMTAASLLAWGKEELRPAAIRAYQGEGDFTPGEHCRFCVVAPRCKALAAKAAALYAERDDTGLMSNEEIAEALTKAASLKSWLTALEAYALQQALEGETFPGFKIVEGRSLRQIPAANQAAAMQALADQGFEEASYCKPKELKTISDLEKLLKKKGFQELLGGFVVKPQGKPTLVEESDPRPPMNGTQSAKKEFKDIFN